MIREYESRLARGKLRIVGVLSGGGKKTPPNTASPGPYSILLAATVAAGTVDEFSVVEPLAESMSQMPTGLRQRKGLACASTESDDRAPVSNEVTERHPSASGSRAPDSLETYTVRS